VQSRAKVLSNFINPLRYKKSSLNTLYLDERWTCCAEDAGLVAKNKISGTGPYPKAINTSCTLMPAVQEIGFWLLKEYTIAKAEIIYPERISRYSASWVYSLWQIQRYYRASVNNFSLAMVYSFNSQKPISCTAGHKGTGCVNGFWIPACAGYFIFRHSLHLPHIRFHLHPNINVIRWRFFYIAKGLNEIG